MRTFLLFLFLPIAAFSQETDVTIKSQIQGTWWLNIVQVEQFVNNQYDQITSGVDPEYALIITTDSVIFDGSLQRFYRTPNKTFSYSITYDTLLQYSVLDLFTGKGKQRKKSLSYNLDLVDGQLILNSFSEITPYPDYLVQKNYLTYSRAKDEDRLYEKIQGDWICETANNFVYTESKDTIKFRKNSDLLPSYSGCKTTFFREHGIPKLSISCITLSEESTTIACVFSVTNGVIDGVFHTTALNFSIDLAKKQLVFNNGDLRKVFNIFELTETEMKLVIHRE